MSYKIDLPTLARRESEQVEWKENVASVEKVAATITAFANDLANLGGGYVVCGARETTDEHGFKAIETVGLTAARLSEVEGQVLRACQKDVTPPLTPLVEVLPADTEDRRVLVFIVAATGDAHQLRTKRDTGKYYVRRSHSTVEARNGLLRDLLVRKGARPPWDRRWHPDATIDDIDLVALRDLLQQLGVWDEHRSLDHYLDPAHAAAALVPSFCIREPLTGTLRPRNFTLLLVGRNPQRFLPDAHAIFSLYPGEDRSEPYAERLEIDGTLTTQARRLIERLNTEAILVMDKSSDRAPNAAKYPRRALHEAVINALVHRDYEAAHPVRVTAFGDRIEVVSPGSLHSAVDPEAFRAGRASATWRNQALAWFLVKLQLAQAEGQGIATILRSMRQEGCPAPEFRITPASIECVLPAHPRHQVMRDLQRAERAIVLGEFRDAARILDTLLAADPFNFRVIELFCEVNRATGNAGHIQAFVESLGDRVDGLPDTAKVLIADALAGEDIPSARRQMARRLMHAAAQGRLEESETRRLVIGLMRIDDIERALDVLDRAQRLHPQWADSPTFLQLRGRTLLQFAKRCRNTAKGNRDLSSKMRRRTWEECRAYLDRAEKALNAALEHAPEQVVRDHAEDDLRFLARLREQATLSARRSR